MEGYGGQACKHKNTTQACVRAACVVTSKCLEDAEVLLDLELLHQHRGFRIHVTASKDLQLSRERSLTADYFMLLEFAVRRRAATKQLLASLKTLCSTVSSIFFLSLLNAQLELFFSEKPWSGFIENVTRASTDSTE